MLGLLEKQIKRPVIYSQNTYVTYLKCFYSNKLLQMDIYFAAKGRASHAKLIKVYNMCCNNPSGRIKEG